MMNNDMVNLHRIAALSKIRFSVRRKYLDYKSTDEALNHPALLDEWEAMSEDTIQSIITHAKKGDRKAVRLEIKRFREDHYAEVPIEVLRIKARARHIKNYSRMSRRELIKAIEDQQMGKE
jgi:hypothetical protein